MNIKNLSSAINSYRYSGLESQKKAVSKPSTAKNVDVLEFSAQVKTVDGAKKAAANSVDGFAGADRIASLKAQVNAGLYKIPSETIASAIIDG